MSQFRYSGKSEEDTFRRVVSLDWLHPYLNIEASRQDPDRMGDATLHIRDLGPLKVEFQTITFRTKDVFLDLISAYMPKHGNCRGITISPDSAFDYLNSISGDIAKWGKFLDKGFKAKLLFLKHADSTMSCFNMPGISANLKSFLDRFGFSFNAKNMYVFIYV